MSKLKLANYNVKDLRGVTEVKENWIEWLDKTSLKIIILQKRERKKQPKCD